MYAEDTIKETFSLEDIRHLEARIAKLADNSAYDELGVWVREHVEQQPGSTDTTTSNSPFGKSSFGGKADFSKYLATLNEEEMLTRCICRICSDMATDPQISDCNHVFCKQCIQDECTKAAAAGKAYTACPICSTLFKEVNPYTKLQARPYDQVDEPEDVDDDGEDRRGKKRNQSKNSWLHLSEDILPSAKLVAAKVSCLFRCTAITNECRHKS